MKKKLVPYRQQWNFDILRKKMLLWKKTYGTLVNYSRLLQ